MLCLQKTIRREFNWRNARVEFRFPAFDSASQTDYADLRDIAFEQSIRRLRRRMGDKNHVVRRNSKLAQSAFDGVDNSQSDTFSRGVRRRNFKLRNDFARVVVYNNDIGKSSADINADANLSIWDFRFGISDFKTKTEDRIPIPQFPNARYFVSRSEYEHAENPSMRDRASYLSENWQPILESGQLELKPDEYEVVEGLQMKQMRGHNGTMQTFRLCRGGETLFGFADLIPTHHHLPLAWIMGYDLYPTETLEVKKKLLPLAVQENWLCFFYHDFEQPLCRLVQKDGKLKAVSVLENE